MIKTNSILRSSIFFNLIAEDGISEKVALMVKIARGGRANWVIDSPPDGRLQPSAPDMAIEPEAMVEKATIAFGPVPNGSGNGICGLS